MKKFFEKTISIIGIISCAIIFFINVFLGAKLDNSEIVKISSSNLVDIILSLLMICTILLFSKALCKMFENKPKIKKIIFLSVIAILYLTVQVVWINIRHATPSYDQEFVLTIAEKMYDNKYDEIGEWHVDYLAKCPQQISLSWFWSKLYRVFGIRKILNLEYMNAVLNTLTFIGIILISKQLGKKYEINVFKTMLTCIFFISLAMFSTFVYGDIPSITCCVYAVYFIMKYTETRKIPYAILSSLLTAIAIIVRTNSYVFFIAIVIYLLLDLLALEKKSILKSLLVFVCVIAFSILPSAIIKNSIQNKLNIDKERSLPTLAYLYMGMSESYKANGWYNFNIMEMTFDSREEANEKYKELINNRFEYFEKNPTIFLKFYLDKIASMWAENTYAASLYNNSAYCGVTAEYFDLENSKEKTEYLNKCVDDAYEPISIVQKGVILFVFGMSIRILFKFRKNISKEVLLLVLIFMGGFFFHILWEAKSRYILLYIVILFPLVSINVPIKNFINKKGAKQDEEQKENMG